MRSSRPMRSTGYFEYLMWLFTRFSGLALLIFAAISMGAAFMLGGRTLLDLPTMVRWMFFPNPNHVINSDIPDISLGWSNTFWQVFAVVMMFLAAGHGINGLRMVFEDYIKRPILVWIWRALMVLLWLGGMVLAVYVILFY
jgi:succinate dehydrogenase / fumarate reductase membrane anchor subunit